MYNQRWVIMFVLQKALHSPPGTASAHSMLPNTEGRSAKSSFHRKERERMYVYLPVVKNALHPHAAACAFCICELEQFEQTINYRKHFPRTHLRCVWGKNSTEEACWKRTVAPFVRFNSSIRLKNVIKLN